MSHLVLQVMEGVAQSGRGGNPSLENIPKSPVLSLPPSVEVSANDTVLWNAPPPPNTPNLPVTETQLYFAFLPGFSSNLAYRKWSIKSY